MEFGKEEIIYAMINPGMPGLVKIGLTDNLKRRVRELSLSTSVPYPFKVHYACTVMNHKKVEAAIHTILTEICDKKVPGTEFFAITPEQAKTLLECFALKGRHP